MTPISDPWFYVAAVPAVFFVGLSKGGFGGTFAMLGVPIMALVISPLQAAGIMLPILIVMDVVALIAYRGRADWKCLTILVPAAIIGIGIGWATAAYVNDAFVLFLIGIMSLVHVLLGVDRKKAISGLVLPDEMRLALSNYDGELGRMLRLSECLDLGEFAEASEICQELGVSPRAVWDHQRAAFEWVAQMI